ncbi:hypothetical protein HMPREF0653_00052 [Prevotella disiens JCM 6334 = ATCC 29426]|uniref:Uncharacterized protein n=1 Tax=Prevotella disiens JCM 6334 = ATCC 29426 TaxID=1235811 RepID=A0ABN0NVQ5_9BACT|nr:hypothetical protein HMPREF0653_00052 [Prevotella disiens JCM 6334 = ATCC 29426]
MKSVQILKANIQYLIEKALFLHYQNDYFIILHSKGNGIHLFIQH